jgi:hypothetical protein
MNLGEVIGRGATAGIPRGTLLSWIGRAGVREVIEVDQSIRHHGLYQYDRIHL